MKHMWFASALGHTWSYITLLHSITCVIHHQMRCTDANLSLHFPSAQYMLMLLPFFLIFSRLMCFENDFNARKRIHLVGCSRCCAADTRKLLFRFYFLSLLLLAYRFYPYKNVLLPRQEIHNSFIDFSQLRSIKILCFTMIANRHGLFLYNIFAYE